MQMQRPAKQVHEGLFVPVGLFMPFLLVELDTTQVLCVRSTNKR